MAVHALRVIESEEKPQSMPDLELTYKYWRLRIMYSMMSGYAAFYLIRQNITMAIPLMQSELGYTKTQIGGIITLAAIIYGLGKGISGLFSDRSNARYFMTLGLFFSAIMNLFMGMSSTLPLLTLFWALNSCFQSMGWPPCARLLTHWFSPREIATRWSIWNMSQQIGGALIVVLSGYLIDYFSWRALFYVPGIMALGMSVFLYNRLRDTPQSLGLPSVEEYQGLIKESIEETHFSFKEIVMNCILRNKLVWYVCCANFFVYIVRMAVFNWAPTFLKEFKGSSLHLAGWQTAAFDLAGMFGGILAGFLSDRVFQGYRGRVGALLMLLSAGCVVLLWLAPEGWVSLHFLGMMLIGFLITGPQILVGVAAADFASKKAAGAASGLTGTLGYLGTAVTGVGIGLIVDHYGWDYAFLLVTISALLSAVFFALTWNHRSKILEKMDEK